MAEAAVEERPQLFYCHMCNVQFENAASNFTCPHCSNGFIEELENDGDTDEVINISDSDEEPYQMLSYTPIDFPQLIPEERRTRYSLDPTRRRRYASVHPRHRIRPRNITRVRTNVPPQNTSYTNLLQEFIVNVGFGVNWDGPGNVQLFFSNPGDYAWGREGLDAIVTQLLNQMDCTGPPPLPKVEIDALPVVEVTQEQVSAKLQCSVCWEDFVLNEHVRQLSCQHVYHEICIRPWLELHGTCPICRQNLGNNEEQSNTDNTNNENDVNNSTGNALNAWQQLFQAVSNSGNGSDGSSSSSSGSDTTTSGSSASSTDAV